MTAASEMRLNRFYSAEKASKEAGFSIVEVLVALVIASIALIAYGNATTTGLMRLKAAAQDDRLVNEIENVFEQLTSEEALARFPKQGQFGAGIAWHLDVKRINARARNLLHEYEVSLNLRHISSNSKSSAAYRTIIVVPE